jgi:hypothetical protein
VNMDDDAPATILILLIFFLAFAPVVCNTQCRVQTQINAEAP